MLIGDLIAKLQEIEKNFCDSRYELDVVVNNGNCYDSRAISYVHGPFFTDYGDVLIELSIDKELFYEKMYYREGGRELID